MSKSKFDSLKNAIHIVVKIFIHNLSIMSFFFTNYAINILVGIAMKMIKILLIHTQEDV